MQEQLLQWFEFSGIFAVVISILVNIVVNLLGVVPATFVMAANLLFFGFWQGLLISLIGEVVGAVVAFYFYRKGIVKLSQKFEINNKYLQRLQNTEGKEAFWLVVLLRLFLFIPAGAVAFVGASSQMKIASFAVATFLGKIPMLFVRAYSIEQVFAWTWQGKVILAIAAVIILIIFIRRLVFK